MTEREECYFRLVVRKTSLRRWLQRKSVVGRGTAVQRPWEVMSWQAREATRKFCGQPGGREAGHEVRNQVIWGFISRDEEFGFLTWEATRWAHCSKGGLGCVWGGWVLKPISEGAMLSEAAQVREGQFRVRRQRA